MGRGLPDPEGRTTVEAARRLDWPDQAPTYRVNEEKWQAACRRNPGLTPLQRDFEAAQRALDAAQREFLEEVTPEPVVYVR